MLNSISNTVMVLPTAESQHQYGVWSRRTEMVHQAKMTPGERIAAEREAKGMKRPALAQLMNTTPQQLERLEKGQRRMTTDWLERAAAGLEVSVASLLGDTDPRSLAAGDANAEPFRYEGASLERARDDLPILGTGLGSPRMFEGEAVEQTTLNTGDIIGYVKRPSILNDRSDAYGLYVQGSSMEPVYMAGRLLIAEAKRPPRIGDDVVVYLRPEGEDDDGYRARAVLVKRLVKRSSAWVELQQFNPPMTFRLEAAEYIRIDRVMQTEDILG